MWEERVSGDPRFSDVLSTFKRCFITSTSRNCFLKRMDKMPAADTGSWLCIAHLCGAAFPVPILYHAAHKQGQSVTDNGDGGEFPLAAYHHMDSSEMPESAL